MCTGMSVTSVAKLHNETMRGSGRRGGQGGRGSEKLCIRQSRHSNMQSNTANVAQRESCCASYYPPSRRVRAALAANRTSCPVRPRSAGSHSSPCCPCASRAEASLGRSTRTSRCSQPGLKISTQARSSRPTSRMARVRHPARLNPICERAGRGGRAGGVGGADHT